MAQETIKVRTTYGDEKPVVLVTNFQYDVPDSIEAALKRFTPEQVHAYFKGNLIIALQAPARKLMADAWEALTDEQRAAYTVMPEKEGGTAIATLPDSIASEIQAFFSTWTPDTKLGRRAVIRPADAVNALMSNWDALSLERQQEIMARLAERFNLNAGSARAEESTMVPEVQEQPIETGDTIDLNAGRRARVRV